MTAPGSAFDPLVDDYDRARPSYPPELFDAVDRLAGPLAGALVVEIGAGTGIATRGLRERGARVLAVDVGERMLARLRARSPGQPVVLASGEQLPVRTGAADLVCAAQAWHWVEPERGYAEVARVLRPAGGLALWWNGVDAAGERWYEDQQARLEELSPGYVRTYRDFDFTQLIVDSGHFVGVEQVDVRWSRRIPVDDWLAWQRSKSYVAAIGDRLDEFLAAERASILAAFPDGTVHEPFRVGLWVARTPA